MGLSSPPAARGESAPLFLVLGSHSHQVIEGALGHGRLRPCKRGGVLRFYAKSGSSLRTALRQHFTYTVKRDSLQMTKRRPSDGQETARYPPLCIFMKTGCKPSRSSLRGAKGADLIRSIVHVLRYVYSNTPSFYVYV